MKSNPFDNKRIIWILRIIAAVVVYAGLKIFDPIDWDNLSTFESLAAGVMIAVAWYLAALPFILIRMGMEKLLFLWATRRLNKNLSPERVAEILGHPSRVHEQDDWVNPESITWIYTDTTPPLHLHFSSRRLTSWRTDISYTFPDFYEDDQEESKAEELVDELERLALLHKQGVLNDEEFKAAKALLLRL